MGVEHSWLRVEPILGASPSARPTSFTRYVADPSHLTQAIP